MEYEGKKVRKGKVARPYFVFEEVNGTYSSEPYTVWLARSLRLLILIGG